MKIGFHSSQLCLRGTEIALYDYAYYNREILGNESIIISDKNANLDALDKFKAEFEVLLYSDYSEVTGFVDQYGIDALYSIKAGFNDHKMVPNAKNLVHTVFQYNDPHGDKYAYVSKWLSDSMSQGRVPYVPHIVDILKYDHDEDLRSELNIPGDATVLGYYGGSDSFNIQYVKDVVIDIAKNYKNFYFIFMNVDKFCDIPNVIFLPGNHNMKFKVAFINTCDACLHARSKGESFGLTIAEYSSKNKPCLICKFSVDSAHIAMLGEKCIKYNDFNNLRSSILNIKELKNSREDWNAYRDYSPHNVMMKFQEVFLN